MGSTTLRGDFIRLHRRGNRVWIRERPYEVVWRTTADFSVDDIHSVEIEARRLELNRRRRLAVTQASTRVRPAVTRITIDLGGDDPLVIDVEEAAATVVEMFADLGDRLVVDSAVVAEHADDTPSDAAAIAGLPPISWRADDPYGSDLAPTTAAAEHPADTRDQILKVDEPATNEDWLELATSPKRVGATGEIDDEELFPADESRPADANGGWVRKRRKRPIHRRVLRG
jgi:hypothetical protein